jgi:hypothetical protein
VKAIRLDECTLPQRRLILALTAAADATRLDRGTTPAEGEALAPTASRPRTTPPGGSGVTPPTQRPLAVKAAALRRVVETAPAGCSAGAVMEVADAPGEPRHQD